MNTHLLAIGGGMELVINNPLIRTFIELAGGSESIITILPTASSIGDEVGQMYTDIFQEFCEDVEYFMVEERSDSYNPRLVERINMSTGIFLTGGNQLKITALLGGSPAMDALKQSLQRDIIIAGTSAGASALSDPMISWGNAAEMSKGQLHLASGIGFLKGIVVDSHFIKRGRISRLLNLVAQHPGILGLGVAEDTGCLFEIGKTSFEVIGARNVIVVDGRKIEHSNIADLHEGMPFSVTNVHLDALGAGYSYNYSTYKVDIPDIPVLQQPAEVVSEVPYKPRLEDSV